jgi:transcriptional regulator with XRE-family HTH domain
MRRNPALVALGEKIRALREARGFSQEAFSNEVNFDRSYYGGIERGERNVAAINLMALAKVLKVEVGELFPPVKELAAKDLGAKRKK